MVCDVQFRLKFNILSFATARSLSEDGSFEVDGIGNSTFFVVFDELPIQIVVFIANEQTV